MHQKNRWSKLRKDIKADYLFFQLVRPDENYQKIIVTVDFELSVLSGSLPFFSLFFTKKFDFPRTFFGFAVLSVGLDGRQRKLLARFHFVGHGQSLGDGGVVVEEKNFERVRVRVVLVEPGQLFERAAVGGRVFGPT